MKTDRFVVNVAASLGAIAHLSLAACIPPDDPPPTPQGIYITMDAESAPPPAAASSEGFTLYLNRDGGVYTRGTFNDSRENTSIIPTDESTISPWAVSDNDWNTVVTCVEDTFARWNIEVVDSDPSPAPHFEAVVGGRSQDLGLDPGFGGVSPFRSNCSLIDNSIVFVFAEVYGTSYDRVCETIAQEVGHSIGLDHAFLCEDPMTYLGGCGEKRFQDIDAPCGEGQERPCACDAPTQNSVEILDSRLGVLGTPRIVVKSPRDGARVPPGFMLIGDASDDRELDRLIIELDDSPMAEIALGTDGAFAYQTPGDIAEGTHRIALIAEDLDGNVSRSEMQLTIDANAIDPSQPIDVLPLACRAADGNGSGLELLLVLAVVAFVARRRRVGPKPTR